MNVAVRSTGKPRGFGNRMVAAVLNSRFHRLMSGRMCLVAYEGRRSGQAFVTPAQYAHVDDAFVVLVANPEKKTWWKNFRGADGWPIDLRIAGRWCEMTGRVVEGSVDDPGVAPLLDGYLAAYPAASKLLCVEDADRRKTACVVFVTCEPRITAECEHDERPCFECMIGC